MKSSSPETSACGSSSNVSSEQVPITRIASGLSREETDDVAVEEPLEIRIAWHGPAALEQIGVSVTMRTPGHDEELALGFLYGEGSLNAYEDVEECYTVGIPWIPGETGNALCVQLRPGIEPDVARLSRHVFTSSSCGVCGKKTLEAVRAIIPTRQATSHELRIALGVLNGLPASLRAAQETFDRTGGLHACAIFDHTGTLSLLREDVGRHNALDKVIGAALIAGRLPFADDILLVSGRASFELVQKAAVAGIRVMAAVGAPSSLAVSLANECGMTLIGFLRSDRLNVYSGPERITPGYLDQVRDEAANKG